MAWSAHSIKANRRLRVADCYPAQAGLCCAGRRVMTPGQSRRLVRDNGVTNDFVFAPGASSLASSALNTTTLGYGAHVALPRFWLKSVRSGRFVPRVLRREGTGVWTRPGERRIGT